MPVTIRSHILEENEDTYNPFNKNRLFDFGTEILSHSIDFVMQMNKPMSLSSAFNYGDQHRNRDNFVEQSAIRISSEFNQRLQLDRNDNRKSQEPLPDSAGHVDDEDEDEFLDCEDEEEDSHEGDSEFTFTYIDENNSPVPADKLPGNGQIQPVFPLFDQKLLSGEGGNRLPVDKVFVESSHRPPSSTSGYDEIEGIAAGPYCTWSKQPANLDLGKKSNSTGFTKLRRLRDKFGRCNSDGRDAYVFLNRSGRTTISSKSVAKPTAVGGSSAKPNYAVGGKAKVVKKVTKAKKKNLSAHEVYLRKREQTEEERRRSYLPYRPELMGFFANVTGGLGRNRTSLLSSAH